MKFFFKKLGLKLAAATLSTVVIANEQGVFKDLGAGVQKAINIAVVVAASSGLIAAGGRDNRTGEKLEGGDPLK